MNIKKTTRACMAHDSSRRSPIIRSRWVFNERSTRLGLLHQRKRWFPAVPNLAANCITESVGGCSMKRSQIEGHLSELLWPAMVAWHSQYDGHPSEPREIVDYLTENGKTPKNISYFIGLMLHFYVSFNHAQSRSSYSPNNDNMFLCHFYGLNHGSGIQ